MYSVVETITPELAKKYLSLNIKNNRNINRKVDVYADDMKNGRWELNSEAITFNESGFLTDGQHRLMAIIKANIPVQMYVTRGESDSVHIHDVGRCRRAADIAEMSGDFPGMSKSDIASSLASAAVLFQCAGMDRASPFAKMEFIKSHIADWRVTTNICNGGTRENRLMRRSPAMAAVFCAIYSGADLSVMKSFCDTCNTGFQSSRDDSAAIVARNFMLSPKSNDGQAYRKELALFVCLAIKDFVNRIPRTKKYHPKYPLTTPFMDAVVLALRSPENGGD